MIIRRVRLAPFGGVVQGEYTLEPGLNVLLGPNEAGKSTLVNAVFAALFIPAEVKKSSDDWRNYLARFLPYPDGDTARVELECEAGSLGIMKLSCAWGGGREERLILADGSEISDSARVRARLQEALRFGRGTYQGVLFARQEEMIRTLSALKENPEASRTVSQLLRSALFEAGGVSLEELEAAIDAEEERLLQNWDRGRDEPRGGRGIGNPHRRGIGAVLAAYYRREELRRKLKEARAAEEQVAALAGRLAETAAEQEALLRRLQELEKLEDDTRRRSALEPQLQSARVREKELKEAITEWPRAEERVRGMEKEIAAGQERQAALEAELEEAAAILSGRRERELLERVRPLGDEIKARDSALKELPPVQRAGLDALEAGLHELTRRRAVLEAMKLKASLQARRPLELTVTAGLDEPRRLMVETEASLEGAGRLLLESPGWTLEVQAGEGDAARLLEQLKRAQEDFKAGLDKHGLKDIGEARSILARREELARSLESARLRLEGLLEGRSPEELEAAVAALSPDRPVRDPEMIRAEAGKLQASLSALAVRLEQERERVQAWEARFGSLDQALEAMAEWRGRVWQIETELERLAPLPAGYASGSEFIAALKEMRERRAALAERTAGLKEELIAARSRLPEESTEDLEAALELAGEELARLKARGEAIRLVKEEFNALRAEMDGDTLAPLVQTFTRNLDVITGHRYTAAAMDGAVPGEIVSAAGRAVPVELLSTGTAGAVALALRLALASYLLQEAGGFLVMDDPLVNLDPERRKVAARLIREFAREKQVIVTTCDPAAAALLGGHVISL